MDKTAFHSMDANSVSETRQGHTWLYTFKDFCVYNQQYGSINEHEVKIK